MTVLIECVECGRYCADLAGHYCPPREIDDCGEVERWDPWDMPDAGVSFE